MNRTRRVTDTARRIRGSCFWTMMTPSTLWPGSSRASLTEPACLWIWPTTALLTFPRLSSTPRRRVRYLLIATMSTRQVSVGTAALPAHHRSKCHTPGGGRYWSICEPGSHPTDSPSGRTTALGPVSAGWARGIEDRKDCLQRVVGGDRFLWGAAVTQSGGLNAPPPGLFLSFGDNTEERGHTDGRAVTDHDLRELRTSRSSVRHSPPVWRLSRARLDPRRAAAAGAYSSNHLALRLVLGL